MAALNGRPALTLLPGGVTGPVARRRGPQSRTSQPTAVSPRRCTVGAVIQAHVARGGWWQLHVHEDGEVGLAAAMDDGWANVFPLEWFTPLGFFDLDGDGTLYAHDIGLPRALWDMTEAGAGS